jgi:hypothetical protein
MLALAPDEMALMYLLGVEYYSFTSEYFALKPLMSLSRELKYWWALAYLKSSPKTMNR